MIDDGSNLTETTYTSSLDGVKDRLDKLNVLGFFFRFYWGIYKKCVLNNELY